MKSILIFFAFCCSITVCAQTVVINKNYIVIDGVRLDSASLLADYVAVLGEPDRKFEGVNNIYTFDELGLYIYENYHDKNKITEISFDFRKDSELDFSPTHKFKGSVFLPEYNLKLNKRTGFRKLRNYCKRNGNSTIELEFGDSQFSYHRLLLLFEHNFWLTKTKNFTIDFD